MPRRRDVLRTERSLLLSSLVIVAACTSETGPSEGETEPPEVAARLAVAGLASSLPAGVATFTVTAEDASGHAVGAYRGTVHFTSTDPLALLPADYAFVGADPGTHTFQVTFKTLGGQTMTATDAASSSITGSVQVTVTAGAAATLAVSGLPCDLVVTVKDAFDNIAAGYTGTVHFTSTDPLAVLPADYTFVSADAGTHTFPLSLKTAGSQTVTATDFTRSLTGSQTVAFEPAATPPGKPLYVANQGSNSIMVYAAGASCNATSTAAIAGSNTGLHLPYYVAMDGGGQIYVSNRGSNSVTVYAAGATGNATPIATIAGSNTGLGNSGDLGAIAVDGTGRLYVANGFNCDFVSGCEGYSITVYAPGASGNVTPIATIAGSNTGLGEPNGITVDAAGQLYVASWPTASIELYAPGTTGNAAPTAIIAGSNTQLHWPYALALDPAGWLYVADYGLYIGDGRILVYAPGATGNATPTTIISGSNTLLDAQWLGIAADAGGRIYVANPSNHRIQVYAAGATGNVAPTAIIAGSNTGLSSPTWLAF